jgi:hypothetical protein
MKFGLLRKLFNGKPEAWSVDKLSSLSFVFFEATLNLKLLNKKNEGPIIKRN